jgi:hypothetical protein
MATPWETIKQQQMATPWKNNQNFGVRHKVLKVREEIPVKYPYCNLANLLE